MDKKSIYASFGTGGNSDDFTNEGFKSTIQIFKWLSQKGLDSYEYEMGNGHRIKKDTWERMGSEAKKYNIKLSIHAPYFIALSSVDEQIRKRSVQYIIDSVYNAKYFGAKIIVVHPGGTAKNTRAKSMELAKNTLEQALTILYKQNITDVKIGLETMGRQSQLGTVDEIIEFCQTFQTDNKIIVPVVDFGHIYAREQGTFLNKKEDYNKIFCIIGEKLGVDILNNLHCHFSKIEYTEKGEKKHRTFQEGEFGPYYEHFIETVSEMKITPNVICESHGTMTEDALKMKNLYMRSIKNYEDKNTDNKRSQP